MRLKKLNGSIESKDVTKYLIKWGKKSKSKYQREVKFFLHKFWKNHIVYEEFPVFGSKMTLDFLNLSRKIAIEVQGEQHSSYNEFFHQNITNYWSQLHRDVEKKRWCEMNGFRLVEIHPKDLPLTQKFLEDNNLE